MADTIKVWAFQEFDESEGKVVAFLNKEGLDPQDVCIVTSSGGMYTHRVYIVFYRKEVKRSHI